MARCITNSRCRGGAPLYTYESVHACPICHDYQADTRLEVDRHVLACHPAFKPAADSPVWEEQGTPCVCGRLLDEHDHRLAAPACPGFEPALGSACTSVQGGVP
ncbi:MAG: hypothetical protein MPK62_00160 [Alphaproteobacteria bacterium]|nr:hypothetical protein [Alphaproteobacteria bacterium]